MSTVLDTEPSIEGKSMRTGDRVFRGMALGAGLFVLAVMASIGIFLLVTALPSLQANSASFFTEQAWLPDADPPVFGIAVLAFGTLLTSLLALVVGVPIAFGVALFIVFYAPRKVATVLGFLVDLLAAVPSIVFGLWGLYYFMPQIVPFAEWLSTYFGWIPLFSNDLEIYTKSILIAGLVLAIMILPTVSAISREVFLQVPQQNQEAALALGATRWEMIRMAVLPFSRPGMISGAMLGLGRALGETIAVALILSAVFSINWAITEPGGNSFAANIALKWGEAGDTGRSALIAAGLVLFVITLAVNMIARGIIARHAEYSGSNS